MDSLGSRYLEVVLDETNSWIGLLLMKCTASLKQYILVCHNMKQQ